MPSSINDCFGSQPNQESILTSKDIDHAFAVSTKCTVDPLAAFPVLQGFASKCALAIALELSHSGVGPEVANRAADLSYRLSIIAALSMHNAIWRAVLPGDETSEA